MSMTTEWPGVWPGLVVSDADPDKGGRLRVRVPQVYGAPTEDERIEDDQLPWALPAAFVTGEGSGIVAVPAVGAAVLVAFVGGDPDFPVWLGGWFPDKHLPSEFSGAYETGPKTWLFRTPNGHVIEMRYKSGEEKIEITSAGGYHLLLDDVQQKALLETPMQKVELSEPSSTVLVSTPGQVNVQAGGSATVQAGSAATVQGGTVNVTSGGVTNMTGVGASIMTYAAGTWQFAALAINSLAALALTAVGVLSLTGAGIVIATTGGAIALGSVAGTKRRLATEDFVVSTYDGHTHQVAGVSPGAATVGTGPPTPLGDVSPSSTQVTQNLTAD